MFEGVADSRRAHDISICLVSYEKHKAHPDLGDDSGFWLRIKAEDASPFKTSVDLAVVS